MPDPEQETPPPTEPATEQPPDEPEAATPEAVVEQPVVEPESSTPSVFSTASMRPEAPPVEPSAPAEPTETGSPVGSGLIDRLFTHIDPISGVVGSTEFRAVSSGTELLGKQQPHYLSQTFVSERPWRITAIELVGDAPPPLCVALGTGLRYEIQVEASAWEGQPKVAVELRVPARRDAVLALALEDPNAKPNIVIHWAVD
jgi:hypothetical protein